MTLFFEHFYMVNRRKGIEIRRSKLQFSSGQDFDDPTRPGPDSTRPDPIGPDGPDPINDYRKLN